MRSKLTKFAIGASIMLAMAFTFSCSSGDDNNNGGGNNANGGGNGGKGNDIKNYKTVVIGDQVWMAENLNYNVSGSRCYNDSIANCNKYGRMYDWETAKTVCPSGWHLPSNDDWDELIDYVESRNGCSYCASKYLRATSGWNNGNGTDAYGFAALPGGYVGLSGGFLHIGDVGIWWKSSESSSDEAYDLGIDSYNEGVKHDYISKSVLRSVRCVKDGGGGNNANGNGQGVPFNENSQIYYEDGTLYTGSGIIEATRSIGCFGDMCEWDHIRVGSVTSGIVNLELDKATITDEYLRDFLNNNTQLSCTSYPENIKSFPKFFVLTNSNKEYLGELDISYNDEQIFEGISYLYFSKAGKINCNSNRNYNIDAKTGWNKIYFHSNYSNGDMTERKYSTNNILTKEKEMKWILERR